MGKFVITFATLIIVLKLIEAIPLLDRESKSLKQYSSRSSATANVAQKRPFCNAFTGCGRKRSDPSFASEPLAPPPPQNGAEGLDYKDSSYSGESIGSLLDLNAEPAVEDLLNKIMSEAKIWEQIQEFKLAKNSGRQRVPVAFSTQ